MCKYNLFLVIFVLITVNLPFKIQAFRVFYVDGVENILALENEQINIECKTDMPLTYCGFLHPSGKRYSFSGSTLSAGHCAIKVQATKNDTGEWRCHIGTQATGLEIIQTIHVRVVTEVAAVQENISARHGKPMTIACTTTRGLVPLSYCRFEPPNGQPFSINSEVTSKNPILGRYYYPANRSLDRGDCAVTIRKVKYEDVGTWTCGAGLDDGQEHIDIIRFEVEGLYAMSTASATGITFGAIGIIGLLVVLGIFAWKKRQFLGAVRADVEEAEAHELEQLPVSPSPRRSPRSPRPTRSVPMLVIQSPSEPSASPLMPQSEE